MKKTTTTLIILLLLIALASIALTFAFPGDKESVAVNTVDSDAPQKVCFSKTVTNDGSSAVTSIVATLYPDRSVSGELDFLPSDKDQLTGSFTGTWQASATATGFDIVHTYSAEGITATTSRLIVINDTYAQIDWDGAGEAEISSDRIPAVACK